MLCRPEEIVEVCVWAIDSTPSRQDCRDSDTNHSNSSHKVPQP